MNDPSTSVDPLDITLLDRLEFACRPDCGLCCYATPSATPAERTALLQIQPEATFLSDGEGAVYIASRPEGGACQFLSKQRCGVHSLRPFPCAVFPIIVHAGTRFQASAVLSCPGISLPEALRGSERSTTERSPRGLASELSAAAARCRSPSGKRMLAEARRGARRMERYLEKEGTWAPTDEVRTALRRGIPMPGPSDFPVEDPPTLEEGEELLPLYFDHRGGPVAIAGHPGGWQLVELRPEGGVANWLGVWPPLTRPPPLDEDAERLLRSYLGYWLERDALFGIVHAQMTEEPSTEDVTARVERELGAIGATVLSRARIRASATGGTAPLLSRDDVAEGIRATDADLLDRPSWVLQL